MDGTVLCLAAGRPKLRVIGYIFITCSNTGDPHSVAVV